MEAPCHALLLTERRPALLQARPALPAPSKTANRLVARTHCQQQQLAAVCHNCREQLNSVHRKDVIVASMLTLAALALLPLAVSSACYRLQVAATLARLLLSTNINNAAVPRAPGPDRHLIIEIRQQVHGTASFCTRCARLPKLGTPRAMLPKIALTSVCNE